MTLNDFARGTEHLEDREHLAARLAKGDRLRIKFGVDPTAPDIHLGHTVPMRRLRVWQEAGHLPVIIIGDWTARIGDPTGRSETRPPLSAETVAANAQTYLDQLFAILDRERTEVRFQSEWFDGIGLAEILRLCAGRTVQQLMQRADFSERMAAERPIGVHELLYPLLQGYDSVAVDADLEIGGTDQLFNLLAARDVQRWYGKPVQDVATFPILEGTDGVRKMSKSYGNYIGVAEPPEEQYGKAMSIPDTLIVRWLALATDVPAAEVEEIARGLAAEEVNPRDAKARLARAIVTQFHGAAAAEAAEAAFRRVHGGGGMPDDVPEAALPTGAEARDAVGFVADALRGVGDGRSGSELRRNFSQGGVTLNDPDAGVRLVLTDPRTPVRFTANGSAGGPRVVAGEGGVTVHPGAIVQIGKRLFIRCVAG
ncbi:MAG: tyrosine--tRNA ligase [Chloroflexi bacterium]|nr:MAG: tyrosine--tRNA ligase [Chloroflexota bacterium]